MNEMWSICAMEYRAAVKRNEVLSPATSWMSPEDVRLRETSRTQRDKSSLSPLAGGPRAGRVREAERGMVGPGWGEGAGGVRVPWDGLPVREDEKGVEGMAEGVL